MQESSYLHQTGLVKNIKESEKYKSFIKEHLQPKIEREMKAKDLLLKYRGSYTEEVLKKVFDTFDPNGKWFGSPLAKRNINVIFKQPNSEINDWIDLLLFSDDDLYSRINKCLTEIKVKGASIGIAALFLYLMDPDKYNIWNKPIEAGLKKMGLLADLKGKDVAKKYMVFNKAAVEFRINNDLKPQEVDWFLIAISKDGIINDVIIDVSPETKSWIFQANPKYYDIDGAIKVLRKQQWSVRQHKKGIKKDDKIYVWKAGPDAGILAVGTVQTDPAEMHEDEESRKFVLSTDAFRDFETRVTVNIDKVLVRPIRKVDLINHPILSNLPNLKNPQGTNFTVTPEQNQALQELIEKGQLEKEIEVSVYSKSDALENLFIEEEAFDYIMNRLSTKQNIILQGPPGVGKTFIAKRLAYYLMGLSDDSRVSMIQFHQSYSYEDFIQGFRPNQDGKFNLRNGIFYEFCTTAMQNVNRPYVFIIDEINRGNLSKIFGEMLMLIESDKRGPEFSVPLTYGNGNSDKFYIPSNIYLIGTMNTADRSLAMVDYALRRRFGFINLKPQFKNPKFRELLSDVGVDDTLINLIIDRLNSLNETIADDTKNLGPGYRIGHSYFCPNNIQEYDERWYRMVIRSEIEPLLQEYWFDDPKRASDHVGNLLSGI